MNVTVSITGVEAVRERFARLEAATRGSVLAKTALELHDYIEREADRHTRTGALFRSVFQRRINENTYEIGHDLQIAPHAVFVVKGTRKHIIRPKDRKVLRWTVGSRYVFARFVKHPGYKGDDYIKRAAAMAPRVFEKHLTAVIGKEK